MSAKPPIVLIHGLRTTPLSWEHRVERHRARGHEVRAPAWPGPYAFTKAAKYRRADVVTESKEYPGRSHFTIGQDGCEQVADDALDWAMSHLRDDADPAE